MPRAEHGSGPERTHVRECHPGRSLGSWRGEGLTTERGAGIVPDSPEEADGEVSTTDRYTDRRRRQRSPAPHRPIARTVKVVGSGTGVLAASAPVSAME